MQFHTVSASGAGFAWTKSTSLTHPLDRLRLNKLKTPDLSDRRCGLRGWPWGGYHARLGFANRLVRRLLARLRDHPVRALRLSGQGLRRDRHAREHESVAELLSPPCREDDGRAIPPGIRGHPG